MAKGSDFEREISKELTIWLTGKPKPYYFWRQPASGSLATIDEKNKNLSGDIRAIHPDAEFFTDIYSLELKTGYPKASFWQHFIPLKNYILKEFWKQCVRDAYQAEKKPMLIYRKLGRAKIVGICKTDKYILEERTDLKILPCITLRFELTELPELILYNFDDFFKYIKPDDIRSLL